MSHPRAVAPHTSGERFSGLYLSTWEDLIVDLCASPGQTAGPSARPPVTPPLKPVLRTFFPPPKPEESWLRYTAWIEVEIDGGSSVQRTLPTGLAVSNPRTPPGPPAETDAEIVAMFASRAPGPKIAVFAGGILDNQMSPPPPPASPPPSPPTGGGRRLNEPMVTVSPRAASIVTLYLNIRAVRVAYPIPCPVLYGPDGTPHERTSGPGRRCGSSARPATWWTGRRCT